MLLDTDTDPSAINKRLVRRLKLWPVGIVGRSQGVGSANIRVIPYQLSTVALDAVQAHRVAALSRDLTPRSASG